MLDFNNSYLFLQPLLKNKGTDKDDSVAQQVEHIPFKDGVLGSNPSWVTLKTKSSVITMIAELFFVRHA